MFFQPIFPEQFHKVLLDDLFVLGYPVQFNGLCHGLSHMAMQAILLDDIETFDKRMLEIAAIPPYKLKEQLQLYIEEYNKRKKNNEVIPDDLKIKVEIRAFFEGILLYQVPHAFKELFDVNKKLPISQTDTRLMIPIVSPEKIQNDTDKIDNFSNNFDHDKMKKMLDILEKTMIKCDKPFSMILSNYNHTITIGCHPTKGWYLIDANQLPSKRFNSTDEMGKAILAAFKTTSNMMIAGQIYGHKSVMETFNHDLENNKDWQAIKSVETQVHSLDDYQNSLLFIEAFWGNLDSVNKLIKAGADVNQANIEGNAPLIASVHHFEVLQALIKANANINHVKMDGNTPLIYAIRFQAIPSINLLIELGANVNQINKKGETPLILAIQSGLIEVIPKLLEAKVDIHQTDHNKKSPLLYAIQSRNIEVIEILLKAGANPNQASETTTPLLAAVCAGDIHLAKLLISQGANVNQTVENGVSPLMAAIDRNNKEMVDLLISKNADVDYTSNNLSPLFLAIESGNIDIIDSLIAAEANVNQADKSGKTALFNAIKSGNIDIVKKLTTSKANVNQIMLSGESPLLTAVESNNIEIIKILLNRGANINQATSSGETALLKAIETGNMEIVKILTQAKADLNVKAKYEIRSLRNLLDAKNINHSILEDLITEKEAFKVIELTPVELAKILKQNNIATFLQQQIKTNAPPPTLDSFLKRFK